MFPYNPQIIDFSGRKRRGIQIVDFGNVFTRESLFPVLDSIAIDLGNIRLVSSIKNTSAVLP